MFVCSVSVAPYEYLSVFVLGVKAKLRYSAVGHLKVVTNAWWSVCSHLDYVSLPECRAITFLPFFNCCIP